MEAYIGQVFSFGFDFVPLNFMLCDGQPLLISQHTLLYSLIGTKFGGDGVATFYLPDLRGRVVIHRGQGPGISDYVMGQKGGSETVKLTVANLPKHSHTSDVRLAVNTGAATTSSPRNAFLAAATGGIGNVYSASSSEGDSGPALNARLSDTGGNAPFEILNPYLVASYCICSLGVFPYR